jgi:hypothetical protein
MMFISARLLSVDDGRQYRRRRPGGQSIGNHVLNSPAGHRVRGMTMTQQMAHRLHRIKNLTDPLSRGLGTSEATVISSALLQIVSELEQALTDCATEMDAISGRIDALETKH